MGRFRYQAWATVTPVQRKRNEDREKRRAMFDRTAYREIRGVAERQIGATLDFADLPPNEQALKAGQPVVRIVSSVIQALCLRALRRAFSLLLI